MVYVFEKIKSDDKDVFIVRETNGKVLCATSNTDVLVKFYKDLGV